MSRRRGLTEMQRRWRLTAALYERPVTRWLVPAARNVLYGALDLRDWGLRRRRPLFVPPHRLRFVGGRAFESVGESFAQDFRELGGLTSESDVLDIGCGVGRMAVPLLETLSPTARYEGFDIVSTGIAWCQRTITPRYPNFVFRLIDLSNERYNPGGSVASEGFRFPYPDDSFDLAIATSVFTHLTPAVAANYLAETARVLRPHGRLFATWYILEGDRPRADPPQGDERRWFPVGLGSCRVVSAGVPEFAIAFRQEDVLRMYARAGLRDPTLHYGRWLGGPGRQFQDVILASAD